MKPPRVYEVTTPSSHSTSRITKIVHSILASSGSSSPPVVSNGPARIENLPFGRREPGHEGPIAAILAAHAGMPLALAGPNRWNRQTIGRADHRPIRAPQAPTRSRHGFQDHRN